MEASVLCFLEPVYDVDEVKLRKKKDKEINYMLVEPLQKAWTTFKPMLTHVI
jgi:hypothetical protein